MGDDLKKVKSGDTLRIPAATFNAFIDAAQDFKNRTANIGNNAGAAIPQANLILVRNDSGTDKLQCAVLGINVPVITPATNETEFKNRIALSCIAPAAGTHEGRFVVLAEAIKNGKMGLAYASGICQVKINVPSGTYQLAEIDNGITNNLIANNYGSAGILWRAGGTGVQWAVVRLGNAIYLGESCA